MNIGGINNLISSPGADGPIGHRICAWGVGVGCHAVYICIVTDHMLDDLEGSVDVRGFGDGFHEGIVSLMIRQVNPIIISKYESMFSIGF